MKLAKAIEILDNHGLKPEDATWGDYLDAVKLGTEALKLEMKRRNFGIPYEEDLLPGETEE